MEYLHEGWGRAAPHWGTACIRGVFQHRADVYCNLALSELSHLGFLCSNNARDAFSAHAVKAGDTRWSLCIAVFLLSTWMATSYFGRPEMFRCSRSNLETSFAADLQESQRLAPIRKQKVKTPGGSTMYRIVQLHVWVMYAQQERIYGTFRILYKQFWWWPSELSQIAWPAVESASLCPAPNANIKVKYFQDVSNVHHALLFAYHQNQSDCKSVAAILTDIGGMTIHRLATFFAPAVTSWRSRVFWAATIPVIFAMAIATWLSHLIEWSPEGLTSHSVECSKLHYPKIDTAVASAKVS